jgi:toxin ParE1/3/4
MQILWLDRPEADLTDLFDYLLQLNPRAALRVYDAIREQVDQLAVHPTIGRPGRVADTRELVIPRTPYVVAYAIDRDADAVVVLRVLHGARRWPDEF